MREIHLDTPFGRLAALRFGHGGTPVLALHGWLDNAASFLPLSAHLDGVDLVALDLPGHGASAHLPAAAEYTLVNAARAVLCAADALGWPRFSLLGHSMGGAIATLVAAGAPQRVERLALIEALGGLTEAEDRTAQRLREAFAAEAEPA
ncbi:MAG TPA: alpha/beta fold hydrolase, partial [Lysobacter sp.]